MQKAGLVATVLLLMAALLIPCTGALAAADGIHQLAPVTSAWDGTDASTTIAPTVDYDYAYGDEATLTYTLPWPFVFYGQSYDRINVDTNGNVWFTATESAYSFNLANSGRGPVIAAWNNDLSSNYYGGVFIQHKTNPERVVIEWQTETFSEERSSLPNNFEVVLFRSGGIRFDYNSFATMTGGDFGSGISKGDGTYYDIAPGRVFAAITRAFGGDSLQVSRLIPYTLI